MQTDQGNAEFAKWWSRWRSRLQRIAARTKQSQPRKAKPGGTRSVTEPSRRIPGEAEFKRYL